MSQEQLKTALLVGNPNCGKSVIFNALTGGNQRLGNWAGVTVEMKEGFFEHEDERYRVIDLPGIYSISAQSEDERVACQALFELEYDLIINVLDASNLERNLYLTMQLIEMRKPMLFVLNMVDVAENMGIFVDADLLSEQLAAHLEGHIRRGEINIHDLTANKLDLEDLAVTLQQYSDEQGMVSSSIDGHLASHSGGKIDGHRLSAHLGAPMLAISAIQKGSALKLKEHIKKAFTQLKIPALTIVYPVPLEEVIARLQVCLTETAKKLKVSRRYVAIKILESDASVREQAIALRELKLDEVEQALSELNNSLAMSARTAIVEGRYAVVRGLIANVARSVAKKEKSVTDKIDAIVLHRFLGIPLFIFLMYLLFWFVMKVGAAFQDFFDISFGAIFVDLPEAALTKIEAPAWIIALLAHGIGAGIQAVSTFVPIIFAMFLGIAFMEDSGYMARAAFLMDKALRKVGLPGKAFVPLIVGFGCTVPALLATRTLPSKRDRMLTMFMAPMMSCSARLPVYALFGAIFFAAHSALMIFSLYIIGVIIALLIGLILHRSLPFNKNEQFFVMELPPYHRPQVRLLLKHTWMRTRNFVFKAGKFLVIAVAVLGIFNSINFRGELIEDPNDSITAAIGKGITPLFAPFGVEKDNWPASVGLLTGIIAKEAVIGTISAIYSHNQFLGQATAATEEEEPEEEVALLSVLLDGLSDAFSTTWENILSIFNLELLSAESGESEEAEARIATNLQASFTLGKWQVYAYLLFVLIYVPCVAVIATAKRELGGLLGFIMITYLTVLAWAVAVLFYQVIFGHSLLWITAALAILVGQVIFFWLLGTKLLERYIVK